MQLGSLDAVVRESGCELSCGSGTGGLLVLLEPVVEVLHVDLESLLSREFRGQLHGESEGVVEPEDLFSVEDLLSGVLRDHLVESPESLGEGPLELLLLGGDRSADVVPLPDEVGVVGPVLVDDDLADLLHEDAVVTDLGHVPGCAPDEPPEDVALSDLGRYHSVAEDECGCPEVVRDDPEVPDVVSAVLHAGDLLELGDDAGEEAGVVDGLLPLGDAADPLETHSGVDVLLLQGREVALIVLEVLHEDVVPDLGVLAAVA